MTELRMAWTWLSAYGRAGRERARERDRGAGIVETVVIISVLVAAALVITAILVGKATRAANNVKTQ
jgi:Flp pilus assembly protein TadG